MKLKVANAVSHYDFIIEADGVQTSQFGGEFAPWALLQAPVVVNGHNVDKGQVVILDPRALVTDLDTGQFAYHPRRFLHRLSPAFVEWLVDNPAWAPL